VGTIAIVSLGVAFASASETEIDQRALDSVLMQADKIVVSAGWGEDSQILYSSTSLEDIEDFRLGAAIDPSQGQFYCACLGTPVIRLYRRGKEILVISNHHGRSMRNSLWANNVPLKDVSAWVGWFDTRGIPGPREELEYSIRLAKESKANEERWLRGMPPAVVPLWSPVARDTLSVDLDPFREALEKTYADRYGRILALLEWYGSGAGPWSGFPSYESHAEKLLLDYSTPELVTAIESATLTDRQVEGAARLLAGWDFGRQRPEDLALVPRHLKSTLLEHALQSDDDDKRARAIAAFRH
jgi:hypothetical protein